MSVSCLVPKTSQTSSTSFAILILKNCIIWRHYQVVHAIRTTIQKQIYISSTHSMNEKHRMTLVIYGIASISYHGVRVFSDSADETDDELTKLAIRESFYVDHCIDGADTEEQDIRMLHRIKDNLTTLCLHIRKRASNRKIVMNGIRGKLHEIKQLFSRN